MSLAVAVPCALLAATAYGAATAAQHSVAHTGEGRADAASLLRLLRSPRWLLGMVGDGMGLLLQVIALSTGPVVVIQPLLVLAVPVALPVGWALGGRRPARADFLACAAVIAALALFFLVAGDPGRSAPASSSTVGTVILVALVLAAALLLAARQAPPVVRTVITGCVAGASFGLVGVLLDATSSVVRVHGWVGLRMPTGWVPLAGVVVVGVFALVLTQISFQLGSLGASLPANEASAPFAAVAMGALLLHERIPVSDGALLAYAVSLGGMVAGTIWLARAWSALPGPPVREHHHSHDEECANGGDGPGA